MNKFFKIFSIIILSLFYLCSSGFSYEEKIKIGLLVPLTGDDKKIGHQIIKSTRIALKDINSKNIEIFPKDTASNPSTTLKSALELRDSGVKIVIGPVFYESLKYLDEIQDLIFVSLTNKTIGLPENVISSGVNATSQLNTIKKFIELNDLKKTIILTPELVYKNEIKKAIKQSKLKFFKHYIYDTEPTKLTAQIEKITNYKIRKQNLLDEIKRVENSDLDDKERQLEKLKKRYTIGNVNFDSIIIADFEESLKSVVTSLLYTDVSPKKKSIITFNQWFDETLLKENSIQPIYYPSISKNNLENFKKKFSKEFDTKPHHLSLLSYDLVGLIYYLSINNELTDINKLFKKKNSFKGKIGIFDIKNNKINHRLNFYKIEDKKITEIF